MGSQPYGFACNGGLNKTLDQFQLMAQPGLATELENFEVKTDGGYRRINGFIPFEATTAAKPDGDNPILGLYPYALGVVAVVNDGIYYSETGDTWLQINRDTGLGGVTEANLGSSAVLTRGSQQKAQFAKIRSSVDYNNNPYGSLIIATGDDEVAHFVINGTGAGRTFEYFEIGTPTAGTLLEAHDKRLCIVDTVNNPSTIYYSDVNSSKAFTTGTSGSIRLADRIVGIKSFRNSLYIFCENTIHRLDDINGTPTIVQVTNNLGCVSGDSIQEIGGDLIFLAPDGFRTVAGTERIGDVELSTVSRAIREVIEEVTNDASSFTISSTVIRDKSQYRLFYNTSGGLPEDARGFIGTLTQQGFQWSEVVGIDVHSIVSDFDSNGEEVYYHGDRNGNVFLHDQGNDFNGTPIAYKYDTPHLDFGDLGTLKTLKYLRISVSPEGSVQPSLRLRYDYESPGTPQPEDYLLASIPSPAIFGEAIFGTDVFGATNDPVIRQTLEGSGFNANFRIFGEDSNAPFTINGLYISFDASGRD